MSVWVTYVYWAPAPPWVQAVCPSCPPLFYVNTVRAA